MHHHAPSSRHSHGHLCAKTSRYKAGSPAGPRSGSHGALMIDIDIIQRYFVEIRNTLYGCSQRPSELMPLPDLLSIYEYHTLLCKL